MEKIITHTKVAGHLQTLYKKPFNFSAGCFVYSSECSLKNASNAICEQSAPTTVWPFSASLRHTKLDITKKTMLQIITFEQ